MKAIVTFDLDKYPNRLFKTKEEWESYKDGFVRYHQQVWCDPEQFPCIAIETRLEWNDNGADYHHHFFIYDFTLEDAKDEGENNEP